MHEAFNGKRWQQIDCSGLPCPLPGHLPNPGIKPRSSALQEDSLPAEPPGKPQISGAIILLKLTQGTPRS